LLSYLLPLTGYTPHRPKATPYAPAKKLTWENTTACRVQPPRPAEWEPTEMSSAPMAPLLAHRAARSAAARFGAADS
jgi:hypothetical protein